MDYLSNAEKDALARRLSYSATVGGWTFVGFGLFTAVIFLLPLLGLTNAQFEYEPELIGGIIPLLLAFFLPAAWLLRRKRLIRAQLDSGLQPASGTVTKIDHTTPSRGIFVYLEVTTPSLTVEEAMLHSYQMPPWKVGEEVELLFLPESGRFFPRYLNHNSDMGRILTKTQQASQRRLRLIIGVLVGLLVVIGMVVGIVSSLSGTP